MRILRLLRVVGLAAALSYSSSSLAVREEAQPGDPKLRDSHVPATVPNISGMWQVRGYERYIRPIDGSDPPWQPWNKQAFDERAAAEAAGTPLYDPTAACLAGSRGSSLHPTRSRSCRLRMRQYFFMKPSICSESFI